MLSSPSMFFKLVKPSILINSGLLPNSILLSACSKRLKPFIDFSLLFKAITTLLTSVRLLKSFINSNALQFVISISPPTNCKVLKLVNSVISAITESFPFILSIKLSCDKSVIFDNNPPPPPEEDDIPF